MKMFKNFHYVDNVIAHNTFFAKVRCKTFSKIEIIYSCINIMYILCTEQVGFSFKSFIFSLRKEPILNDWQYFKRLNKKKFDIV